MNNTILEMKKVNKYLFDSYGKALKNTNVKILRDVDFDLREGEVHVLVGENGAGKSTLMNILGGILPLDDGEILLDGKTLDVDGPREAREKGIAFIHQELNLCLNLDIAHNIFLGREPKKSGLVDSTLMYEKSRELLKSLGYESLNPRTLVRDLTTAYQQVVEIVKCLSYRSRILIMDEPTTSLSQKEITHLFSLIKKMKKDGLSIIYISHRFDELVEIGDRITVLRDGCSITTMDMGNFNYDEIVSLMVGRTLGEIENHQHLPSNEVILELKGLKIAEKTEPVDLVVHKGEIVGLGGLVGSGRTELAKCIFGARKIYGGRMIYKGVVYSKPSPIKSINNRIAYLSEDRKLEGILTAMNIRENISMAALRNIFRNKIINRNREKELAAKGIKNMNVSCRSMEQVLSTLSGGNQQKVLFSKWQATQPELFILDEPTKGIDVNAKAEIYKIIDSIAKQGVAIIMISSELPELIGMSDRIYVMRRGSVSLEINDRSQMTQENILKHTLG